jgi:hypothetical protein
MDVFKFWLTSVKKSDNFNAEAPGFLKTGTQTGAKNHLARGGLPGSRRN